MVLPAAPLPPPPLLICYKVHQINRQRVAEPVIGLAEHAGGVEAAVEGDVEQERLIRVPRAARVILEPRVDDHLGYEFVRRVPIHSRVEEGLT